MRVERVDHEAKAARQPDCVMRPENMLRGDGIPQTNSKEKKSRERCYRPVSCSRAAMSDGGDVLIIKGLVSFLVS